MRADGIERIRLTDVTMTIHRDTDHEQAILASDDGDKGNAVWLPRSEIEYVLNGAGPQYIVTMPEWLAKKKGLI